MAEQVDAIICTRKQMAIFEKDKIAENYLRAVIGEGGYGYERKDGLGHVRFRSVRYRGSQCILAVPNNEGSQNRLVTDFTWTPFEGYKGLYLGKAKDE